MTKITNEYLTRHVDLLRTDPAKFLSLAEELVRQNPDDPDGYFSRYQARNRLGQKELALADLNKVVSLQDHWINFESRGCLLLELGRYEEALEDFNRAEAANPERWSGGFGALYRAYSHARLGNKMAALADCARLRENHWTPGLYGSPAGTKKEVIAQVRRLVRSRKPARKVRKKSQNN